jgi:hypothetical protein
LGTVYEALNIRMIPDYVRRQLQLSTQIVFTIKQRKNN